MINYEINYKIIGQGEEILFIPGWNDNLEHFKEIALKLHQYKIIMIDLPNQGNSKPIYQKIEMNDYIEIIHNFIVQNSLNPKIIIGHSFGGKLAFLYALKYPIKKLILVAPSLIKNKSFLTYFKIYKYKFLKNIKFYFNLKINLNKYGSDEYKNQKGVDRQNFIIATNNYYNKSLYKIEIPTLLYYGKFDKATPLKEGKYIHKKIKNSKLIIDENGDHFAMYNNPYLFIRTLKEFLND